MIYLFIFLCLCLFLIVILFFIKDRRDISKKTVEKIGHDLWKDIEKERTDAGKRARHFREELERAEKNKKH